MVTRAEGQALAVGVEAGSQILAINEQPVEDMPTSDIQVMLDRQSFPVTIDLKPPLNLPGVILRKVRRKDPVTVCTAMCRGSYRAVREAVRRLGWQDHPGEHRGCSVIWLEHADSTVGLAPVQTVSRIDAFLCFCQKARLAQCLNPWVSFLPESFGFSPLTWVLPWDDKELKAAMDRTKGKDVTYICKPTGGAQGKGITLVRKWKDIENVVARCRAALECSTKRAPLEYVVQEYIAQPLVVDGLKFDVRLYVVVTSVVPLRAYLFKEGLARFCTVPYQPPQDGNLRDACMHLTNFAVNKKSTSFQASESLASHDEGSKRSASAVFHQISVTSGVDIADLWSSVACLAANTLAAMRPSLVEWYVHEKAKPLHPLGPKSFQIVGLDVMFDANLEARLLEINANSSLNVALPTAQDPAVDPSADGGDVSLLDGVGPLPAVLAPLAPTAAAPAAAAPLLPISALASVPPNLTASSRVNAAGGASKAMGESQTRSRFSSMTVSSAELRGAVARAFGGDHGGEGQSAITASRNM
jgi:hypothetical protein